MVAYADLTLEKMYGIRMLVLVGTAVIIQRSLGNVQYGNNGNNENIQENEQVYLPQSTNDYNYNEPVNRNVPDGNAGNRVRAVTQASSVRANNGGNNVAESTWQTRGTYNGHTIYYSPYAPEQNNLYNTYGQNNTVSKLENKTNGPPYLQRNDFQNVNSQSVQNPGNVEVPVRIVYQQQLPSPPIRRTYPNNYGTPNRNTFQNGEGQGYRYNNQNRGQYWENRQGQVQYPNHRVVYVNTADYNGRYPNTYYVNTGGNGYGNQQWYPNVNHESTRTILNDQVQEYPNINPGNKPVIRNTQAQGNQNVHYTGTPAGRNGKVQRIPNINSGNGQSYPNGQGNIQNNFQAANSQQGGSKVPSGNNLQNSVTNGNIAGKTPSLSPMFVDLDRFVDGMDEIIYD